MENLHGGFAYVSYAHTTMGHDNKKGTHPSTQHAMNTGSTARRMPASSTFGINDNTRHSQGMDMIGTTTSYSYSMSMMTARSRTGSTAWNPDAGSMKLTNSQTDSSGLMGMVGSIAQSARKQSKQEKTELPCHGVTSGAQSNNDPQERKAPAYTGHVSDTPSHLNECTCGLRS